MKKILKFLLSTLAIFGVANASTNSLGNQKIDFVSNISEDSSLMLNHIIDIQKEREALVSTNQDLAYHYSHRSHYSHQSHQSHYSHYSSYDDSSYDDE